MHFFHDITLRVMAVALENEVRKIKEGSLGYLPDTTDRTLFMKSFSFVNVVLAHLTGGDAVLVCDDTEIPHPDKSTWQEKLTSVTQTFAFILSGEQLKLDRPTVHTYLSGKSGQITLHYNWLNIDTGYFSTCYVEYSDRPKVAHIIF